MFYPSTQPSIDEVAEAETWLLQTLSASAAVQAVFGTRISAHPAPREWATYPILTYEPLYPQIDTHVQGGDILWSVVPFTVRGINNDMDQTILRPGVVAIHDAIHRKMSTTANAEVWCVRDKPFRMFELTDGVEYLHKGGIYLCTVRPRS